MNIALVVAVAILIYMSTWFGIAVILKRNDIADIAWGIGFIFIAWISWIIGDNSTIALIVNLLVTVWGARLAWHIYKRNRNKPEDFRYAEWRRTWKYFYLRSYLQIFILQGIFMYLIATPVWVLNSGISPFFQNWGFFGLLIWAIGFFFESVGDAQLKAFISNVENKGKLMISGLWKYTRHPNYFGEVTQWWGIFIVVAGMTGNLLTIIGPLTISWLILFVSGIPMLEKKYAGRQDWEEYKKKTSMFLPLMPKT